MNKIIKLLLVVVLILAGLYFFLKINHDKQPKFFTDSSGLEWYPHPYDKSNPSSAYVLWDTADTFCTNLNASESTGGTWRLPTKDEMLNLYQKDGDKPGVPLNREKMGDYSVGYWTSEYLNGDPKFMIVVNNGLNTESGYSGATKSNYIGALCVRNK